MTDGMIVFFFPLGLIPLKYSTTVKVIAPHYVITFREISQALGVRVRV